MTAIRLVPLNISEPGERLERGVIHGCVRHRLTAHQKRVGQCGVAITQTFFKPAPFWRAIGLIQREQSSSQFLAHLTCPAVAIVAAQIFVNADQREGPRPRTRGR